MARQVTDSTNSPLEDGFERYIGMEHLDPESLTLRRWGQIADDQPTFTRIFRSGQVLFGRRRAYQRKAALATFDGICSGDIIVMEANPQRLLPELLPFIVQTEGFYQHALSTSAGSLSPRTKWVDLAKYEFPLPPLDEQQRIAEILWAVEEAIEAWQIVHAELYRVLNNFLKGVFTSADLPTARLGDHVIESAYGPRFSNERYSVYGAIGLIRTTDLSEDGIINYQTTPKANLDPADFEDHFLQDGDFMISRSGTCGIGCVFEDQGYPIIPGAFLIRLRLKNTLHPYFLKEYINSHAGRLHMNRITQGAVQRNIRGSLLLEQNVPIGSLKVQNEILTLVHEYRSRIQFIIEHLIKCKALKAAFLSSFVESGQYQTNSR